MKKKNRNLSGSLKIGLEVNVNHLKRKRNAVFGRQVDEYKEEYQEEEKKKEPTLGPPRKKKKTLPKKEDLMELKEEDLMDIDYGSDLEENDEDAKITLTYDKKFELLESMGARKATRLSKMGKIKFKVIEESGKTIKVFKNKRELQAYAYQRALSKKGNVNVSDIDQKEYFRIGEQTISIKAGTGFFIQSGGNKDKRPEKIKEPKEAYQEIFPEMLKGGTDKSALVLLGQASPGYKRKNPKEPLTEQELAAILLYLFKKSDLDGVFKELERTQFVENIQKFYAICNAAELMRSLVATKPYDASLFIRRGLQLVQAGKYTLMEVFYKGVNKKDSLYIGAPKDDNDKNIVGGAQKLKNPWDYEEELKRQMSLFPSNKKEFKAVINSLRTDNDDSMELKELSEEDEKRLEEQRQKVLKEAVENLQTQIEKIKFNDYIQAANWLQDSKIGYGKCKREVDKMKKQLEGKFEEDFDKLVKALKKTYQRAIDAVG